MVVTETQSFKVTPGVQSTAEPGQKFRIFDLPPAIEAALPTRPNFQNLDFNLDYNLPPGAALPPTIKAIFAGRVEVGGEAFYFPLLPCTSDFSQIPAFQINPVMNIFDLLFFAFNNPNLVGCDNQVYDFTALDTPAIDIRKEVSVDGGVTFFDANNGASAPVTVVGGGAQYRLIVTNTGDVDLVNVVINDPTLGIVDFPVGDLPVGQVVMLTSGEIPALAQTGRCQIPGDVTNIATVDGDSVATGDVVSDSDPAVVACEAAPANRDVDADGDVDRSDVGAIMAARNTPATGPDDLRVRAKITSHFRISASAHLWPMPRSQNPQNSEGCGWGRLHHRARRPAECGAMYEPEMRAVGDVRPWSQIWKNNRNVL